MKWCAVFPHWDFGEVTAQISGTWGPWEEVTKQLETLLSGPMVPNDFHAIGDQEVSFAPRIFSGLLHPSQ